MTATKLSKVLIVEDDNDIRQITQLSLESVGGLTVEACPSGAEALEKAPAFMPDLAVIDVMMPDMDGPSTFQALKKIPKLENLPVVFMTAKVMPEEVAHYLSLGVKEVIAKPFDPMTLSDQLNAIWDDING